MLNTGSITQHIYQVRSDWITAYSIIIIEQTESSKYYTSHSLQLDACYIIFKASSIGEAIHVRNELQIGSSIISRVKQAKHACTHKTFSTELRIITRSDRYCHVEAKHITKRGEEIIDERFTRAQRVARSFPCC